MKDKVVVVTGASRGIGRAIAYLFGEKGATVIVNYNGSKEKAEEVVGAIEGSGGRAEAMACDVSDYGRTEAFISQIIEKYGRIDVLVNNAGVVKDGLLLKMTEEDFDRVVQVNLKGSFNCIKHVTKHMLKQRSGRIVNISSISGVMGNAGQVNYSASKAGVIGLTKATARELAPRGITVNAVAPGFIETEMTEGLSDKVKETMVGQIPLKGFGHVEDVAAAVLYLASDEAGYVTGQVLQVDGGMAM